MSIIFKISMFIYIENLKNRNTNSEEYLIQIALLTWDKFHPIMTIRERLQSNNGKFIKLPRQKGISERNHWIFITKQKKKQYWHKIWEKDLCCRSNLNKAVVWQSQQRWLFVKCLMSGLGSWVGSRVLFFLGTRKLR